MAVPRGAALRALLLLPAAIAAGFVASGCSTATDTEVTPWLRERAIKYSGFGGLSGGHYEHQIYVRLYGFFWHQLDESGSGGVRRLSDDTVFFFGSGYGRLIDRGDRRSRPACAAPRAGVTIPRESAFIDCVDVAAGPAAAAATALHWRRSDTAGRTLADRTIAVDAPGRVFMGPLVGFYDARATPHFVTMVDKDYVTPRCTLMALDGDGAHSVVDPAPIKLHECSDPRVWSRLAGYQLYDASR